MTQVAKAKAKNINFSNIIVRKKEGSRTIDEVKQKRKKYIASI